MPKKARAEKRETINLDARGQLTIPLDAEYTLRPSWEAIMEAEQQTGLALFDLASLAANNRMSVEHMAICVAAFMRAHGRAVPDDPLKSSYLGAKAETIAPLIYEAGVPKVMVRLVVLLAGALHGGYSASGEAKTPGS